MRLIVSCLFLFISVSTFAQGSFWFGPKFGPTIGTQKWNSFNQQPLIAYHGALFVETFADEGDSGSVFAQLGYHTRGSAIQFNINNGGILNVLSSGFRFQNVSLLAGAKRFLTPSDKRTPYYFVGARVEYTVSTNLNLYEETQFAGFYPVDFFVQKWNYGITVGGGYKFTISEKIGAFVDLSISPDLSFQYQQPALGNVVSPFGGSTTISERQIRNLSLEISFGINILRKVVYVD